MKDFLRKIYLFNKKISSQSLENKTSPGDHTKTVILNLIDS